MCADGPRNHRAREPCRDRGGPHAQARRRRDEPAFRRPGRDDGASRPEAVGAPMRKPSRRRSAGGRKRGPAPGCDPPDGRVRLRCSRARPVPVLPCQAFAASSRPTEITSSTRASASASVVRGDQAGTQGEPAVDPGAGRHDAPAGAHRAEQRLVELVQTSLVGRSDRPVAEAADRQHRLRQQLQLVGRARALRHVAGAVVVPDHAVAYPIGTDLPEDRPNGQATRRRREVDAQVRRSMAERLERGRVSPPSAAAWRSRS